MENGCKMAVKHSVFLDLLKADKNGTEKYWTNFSTGLRSGPLVEQIVDSTNQNKVIVTFYVEDEPVIIVSKDSFPPCRL